MFLFKKPKEVVDCFTTDPSVFEYYKIQSSVKFYPDWWKKLPASGSNWKETAKDGNLLGTNTMKSCVGFIELYKRSFSLPLWSDLRFSIYPFGDQSYRYQFADQRSEITVHHPDEHGHAFHPEQFQHFKLHSPWHCFSKTDLKWSIVPPVWDMLKTNPSINILPAVVDFSTQVSTNIPLFVEKTKEHQLLELSVGTVLSHMIPITEKKVSFNHHLVSEKELERVQAKHGFSHHNFFSSSYAKVRKRSKSS